jgi:hypothetical protein
MAVTLQTVLLASVSEFGDLGSYVTLSQGSRVMRCQLAASMIVVRNHSSGYFVRPIGACSLCSGYGDDLEVSHGLGDRRCFRCGLCGEAVCEHCVLLATFGGDAVQPTSWTCPGHVDPVPTVESFRSWLFELADDRLLDVYKDYNFDFCMQFITLSGEVVRDEQNRPCSVLVSSWDSPFDQVWDVVYYCTGGRILQMLFGNVFVDDTNKAGVRWSHFLTRPVARAHGEQSPLQVTVLLRGWF